METFLTIGKLLLVLLAVNEVALTLISERKNYDFIWSIWRRFNIKMFLNSLLMVALTVFAYFIFSQIPGLDFGWLNIFFKEGGNILLKPIQEGSHSSSIFVRALVPVFFSALIFVLPFFAKAEETIFRKGQNDWKSIVENSFAFGLIHCFFGIPLAAGIALILPGLYLGFKYKEAFDRNIKTMKQWKAEKEAMLQSTAHHTLYNTIVVGLLLIMSIMAI